MTLRDIDILIGKLIAIEIELHNAAKYAQDNESKMEINELADQVGSVLKELKKRRILRGI